MILGYESKSIERNEQDHRREELNPSGHFTSKRTKSAKNLHKKGKATNFADCQAPAFRLCRARAYIFQLLEPCRLVPAPQPSSSRRDK